MFTYMHPDVAENAESFTRTERFRRTLSRVGERWTSGLHPADTSAFLAERGLELTEDLVASEYRARRLGDPWQGYEFHHVVMARVVGLQRPNSILFLTFWATRRMGITSASASQCIGNGIPQRRPAASPRRFERPSR